MLAVQPGDHISAAFTSPADFARRTIRFAEQAIAASAQVMIFPGPEHRDDLPAFQRFLAGRSRVIRSVASGQLQVLDSRQVQLAPGRLDRDHLNTAYAAATGQAVAAGFSGLWVSVDMSWAAGAAPDELVGFEAEAFPLFTSRELTAVCHYDTRVFPPAQVTAACQAHPAGPGSRAPLRHQRLHGDRTLRLTGEADLANTAAFAALIRGLRPGDTLDISHMTFLDVRALCTIVREHDALGDLALCTSHSQDELLELVRAAATFPPAASASSRDDPFREPT
jgi:hypothetical protein